MISGHAHHFEVHIIWETLWKCFSFLSHDGSSDCHFQRALSRGPPPPEGRSVVRPMGTVAYRGKGQGKGKGRGEGRIGQGGRGRSKGGEKLMGTTADGGKGAKGRAVNGDRPVGAARCRREQHTKGVMPNPPHSPPSPGPTVPRGLCGCLVPDQR